MLLTYFVYAPLRMLAFRDFRRLLCVCLSLVVRLWRGAHVLRVRSAPRPRLSRLLPFALWQDTSLQAKKQCSRRTTKHNFGCAFFFVRLCVCCSRTSCTLRYACSPFAIFGVCSASACLLLLGCGEVLTYFVYAPLLVLVFLGSCRLLFGKTPLCKQKSSVQDVQPSTTSVVLFLCQAVGEVLTYFVYAPRLVLVFLDLCALFRVWSTFDKRYSAAFRDVQRLLCARLSLCFKHAPRPIISLFQTRSAPRSRLSRLLPFALWQDTSLQAKKQCSRRTTKARRFAVLFDIKSVDKRCVFRLLFYIRDRG